MIEREALVITRAGEKRLILDFYSKEFADDFEGRLRRVYREKKEKALRSIKRVKKVFPRKKSLWAQRRE